MYWAIRLDDGAKQRILGLIQSAGIVIPADWTMHLDHITLAHSANLPTEEWMDICSILQNFKGYSCKFRITHYGTNGNVMALGVNTSTLNEHSHITIATAPEHHPVESNEILTWISVLCLEEFEGYLVCNK